MGTERRCYVIETFVWAVGVIFCVVPVLILIAGLFAVLAIYAAKTIKESAEFVTAARMIRRWERSVKRRRIQPDWINVFLDVMDSMKGGAK